MLYTATSTNGMLLMATRHSLPQLPVLLLIQGVCLQGFPSTIGCQCCHQICIANSSAYIPLAEACRHRSIKEPFHHPTTSSVFCAAPSPVYSSMCVHIMAFTLCCIMASKTVAMLRKEVQGFILSSLCSAASRLCSRDTVVLSTCSKASQVSRVSPQVGLSYSAERWTLSWVATFGHTLYLD